MKNRIFISLIFLLGSIGLWSQESMVFDNLSIKSKILKAEKKYAVYLPPGYKSSSRSYPVLYLLHGAGDDQTGWIQFGEVQKICDDAIANSTASPMIIIMPDANSGVMGYFNDINGNWDYERYFFEELMPAVEANYRIKSEKRYRAVAGLSMGGWGSFIYAMRRPDLFGSSCPLSAYIGPDTKDDMSWFTKTDGIADYKISEYIKKHNVLQILDDIDDQSLKSVRWYIDCGDDDFLYKGNSMVHILMRDREIPHEYRVRDGSHTWAYWRSALPKVLEFVSEQFHQN